MTASAFAELVQARPTGRGRWQARCSAHPDKLPSLAIREGTAGRVLVRCWAGCELSAILAALRLTLRDLFPYAALDPEALAQVRTERLVREAAERERAKAERELTEYMRRGHFAVMALGATLARAPEDDEIAETFHAACDLPRIAEGGFQHVW